LQNTGTAIRRAPHPNCGSSLKQNSAKNEAIGDRLFLVLFQMTVIEVKENGAIRTKMLS
jgi:hypothetical protein